MDTGEALLRATIWASLLAWVGSELLRASGDDAARRRARTAWSLGAVFAVVHSLLAFEVRYGWDHDAALQDAARQIASVTRLDFARGFFVNYVFLAAWSAHAGLWWTSLQAYDGGLRGADRVMRGFAFFMFLNGAIVFGHGAVQWVGALAVLAVVHAWYRRGVTTRPRTA